MKAPLRIPFHGIALIYIVHRRSVFLFVISVNKLISYGELFEVGTLKSKPTVDQMLH